MKLPMNEKIRLWKELKKRGLLKKVERDVKKELERKEDDKMKSEEESGD